MAQTKVYPATKQQAENIQTTVDEINSKVGGQLQVKTVMPSNVQQTVQADAGYTALSGVVVNPIAALMPQTVEDYIMRNERTEPFSINVNGSIPDYACYGQIHLAAVYGELNGTIGGSAFQNCSSLQNIDARSVTLIGGFAFQNCSSLQNIDARSATSIGGSTFQNCSSLQNIDARSATSIGGSTFQNCSSLQNIDARSVTLIGGFAFQNCSSLQNIDARSVTSIGSFAFQNCSSLQNIDARSVTLIGGFAFQNCSSLQNIDARSVTSIGSSVFDKCSNLQNIDCTSCTTPPTIQSNTFANTHTTFHVIVATDTEKALFQSATNWSTRADQIYTVAEIEALYGDTYDNLYLQWFGHPRFDESEGE